MAQNLSNGEPSRGEEHAQIKVRSLENQVETLKEENDALKKKYEEDRECQNTNTEFIEKMRDQHRKEKKDIEKKHKDSSAKATAEFEEKLDHERQERQDAESRHTDKNMAFEKLQLDHANNERILRDQFEEEKRELEGSLRQEIDRLSQANSREQKHNEKVLEEAKQALKEKEGRLARMQVELQQEREAKEKCMQDMETLKGKTDTDVNEMSTRLEQEIQSRDSEITKLKVRLAAKVDEYSKGIAKQAQKDRKDLEDKIKEMEKELSFWKNDAANEKKERQKLKGSFQTIEHTLKRVQEDGLENDTKYKTRIDSLVANHNEQKAKLLNEHEQKLRLQKQQADHALESVKSENVEELNNRKDYYEQTIETLSAEHTQIVADLRTRYEDQLAEKEREQAAVVQTSARWLDDRERRLKEESVQNLAASEKKVAQLDRVLGEKNEQLLNLRDRLSKEHDEAIKATQQKCGEENNALRAEHERLRNEINQNYAIVVRSLETRIDELKAELNTCKGELNSEVGRLTKEGEDMVAAAKEESRCQKEESDGKIRQLELQHKDALDTVRQEQTRCLHDLKEKYENEKASSLDKMFANCEERLRKAKEERDEIEMKLCEELRTYQEKIENLVKEHEEAMQAEGQKQEKCKQLLHESAKYSKDDMIKFLTDSHAESVRELAEDLRRVREDCKASLKAKDKECSEKSESVRGVLLEKNRVAEEKRAQDVEKLAVQWGARVGELQQQVETFKVKAGKLKERNVKEESDEINRLRGIIKNLEQMKDQIESGYKIRIEELKDGYLKQKQEYEEEAFSERSIMNKEHIASAGNLVSAVNKMQQRLDEKENQYQQELAELKSKKEDLKRSSNEELGTQKKELDENQRENTHLKDQIQLMQSKIDELLQENESLKKCSDKKEAAVTNLENQIKKLEQSRDEEKIRGDNAVEKNMTLLSELDEKDKEITSYRAQLEELQEMPSLPPKKPSLHRKISDTFRRRITPITDMNPTSRPNKQKENAHSNGVPTDHHDTDALLDNGSEASHGHSCLGRP